MIEEPHIYSITGKYNVGNRKVEPDIWLLSYVGNVLERGREIFLENKGGNRGF